MEKKKENEKKEEKIYEVKSRIRMTKKNKE
jgi:hypothetical protein